MIRPPNRFILTLILTLSLLSATINFQNLITDSVWASGQQEPGESSQSFASDSEIVVPPYCNWVLNLPESISFRPVDSDGVEISGFIYNGQEQNIQSTLSQETYYVAGQSGLIAQAEENNCSWFNEPGVGAGISFRLSGSTFQAYGRDPITGALNRDTAMDIELDGSNPMSFSRIFNTACTSNGFDLGSTGLGLTATNFSQDFSLVGLSPAALSTNNFCSATSQYNMKIPANLKPYISNTEYVWYGPTITFTAVLTTDGASTYSSLSAQEQTITFNQPADMTMVQSPQTLQATASSGLAVTLTSNTPAVCSIVSGQAVQVGSGTCSITASQPGQALNYSAATSVTRSFIISKADQSPSISGVPSSVNKAHSGQAWNYSPWITASDSHGTITWSLEGANRERGTISVNTTDTSQYLSKSGNPIKVGRNWQTGALTLRLTVSGNDIYNSYTRTWSIGW